MYHMATRDAFAGEPDLRHKLAECVRGRRLQLGLSVRTAADQAGVARGTWTALEEGSRRTADNNWAGIERSLGWAPGSIAAILSGGDPRMARAATDPSGGGSAIATGGGDITAAAERDEAVRRVMLNPDLSDDDKRRIAALLIEDERRAAQHRVERAEELIRLVRGED